MRIARRARKAGAVSSRQPVEASRSWSLGAKAAPVCELCPISWSTGDY